MLWFVVIVSLATTGQELKKQSRNCGGLHAGITAEMAQGYEEPSVIVAFVLLNDTETTLNPAAGPWEIVIDGKTLPDSDYILGNGPMPTGGYVALAPGATFNFSKVLPVAKYFPERREYTVSWKGNDFQSPTITFLPIYKGHNASRTK
jgi:hypothetical protein